MQNMIALTRINGKPFVLNANWIEQIESLPDTTLTLTNGKKIVVNETVDDVTQKVKLYYKEIGLLKSLNVEKEDQGDVQK